MPVGNVSSPPSSSLMLNLTCFLGFSSAGVGALLCHTLLLDSQVLAFNSKSHIWRHSHPPGGLDLGGLGNDDKDCLWHSGDRLWCHLDLLLSLNWEHHFHDPDCPVGESSLACLAASLAHGSAEGGQVCKAEQPQEHLLLLEGLIKLGAPCRPTLAICLIDSCSSSLMQSLCCQWESMLGANVHSPL